MNDFPRGVTAMLAELQTTLTRMFDEAPGTYGVSIHHFESGEQFSYNADEIFYAASIIKVPIMAAVFDQAAKGQLRLSEKMTLHSEDMVMGSGLLQNLSPGTEFSLYDLVVMMIIESDNTATNMLIDRLGKAAIQDAMKEWGLTRTEFHNKISVIPAKLEHYNLICAAELTQFLQRLAAGKIVSWRASSEMVKIMKQQKFNDGIPRRLPPEGDIVGELPAWEMAHKTGWVNGLEHDMGLLYFPGHTFAVSIFSKDIPEREAAHRVMGDTGRLLFDTVSK
jgi:beta-lactamase class A